MPITATCPSCESKLTVPDTLAGRRVTCPRCGGSFAVSRLAGMVQSTSSVQPPRTKKKPKRRSGRPPFLVGIVVGGVGLVIVAGIVLTAYFREFGKADQDLRKTTEPPKISGNQSGVPVLINPPIPTGSLPEWKPDGGMLDHLAPETAVDGYRVRPPQGYRLEEKTIPGGQGFAWVGAARTDGTAPQFKIIILTAPPGQVNRYTADVVVDKFLGSIRGLRQDWTQTATQQGQVNGLRFARGRWSGTESVHQWKMHGFSYATVDGQKVIQIDSQDVEPHHEQALKLAEAAALTLRKP